MKLEPFSLPLVRPLKTAAGTIETREGFLVRVRIDGVEGMGEATPLPGWTESLSVCERALRAVNDPRSALEDDELSETPAARHGLSLAVLDAAARIADEPLYRHLGGAGRSERVPVNATVGDGTPDETAAAAEAAKTTGYPAVKLKVGNREPAADVDRLEAVRRRCPDIELRIDANGAWTDDTAGRLLPTLSELDVAVLEQPLSAGELSDHARLRGRGVEIALDESVVREGVDAVLSANAADLLVCKPMALGGIDRAHEAIETAGDAGTDTIVTTTIDGAIARAGAIHLAASISDIRPSGLATGDLLGSDLRSDVGEVDRGSIAVPQGKGNIPRR